MAKRNESKRERNTNTKSERKDGKRSKGSVIPVSVSHLQNYSLSDLEHPIVIAVSFAYRITHSAWVERFSAAFKIHECACQD